MFDFRGSLLIDQYPFVSQLCPFSCLLSRNDLPILRKFEDIFVEFIEFVSTKLHLYKRSANTAERALKCNYTDNVCCENNIVSL